MDRRRRNQPLQVPTFAQTVVIIQTMPSTSQADVEAIIQQHLALGFSYRKDQIYRAQDALNRRVRQWSHNNRPSGRST